MQRIANPYNRQFKSDSEIQINTPSGGAGGEATNLAYGCSTHSWGASLI